MPHAALFLVPSGLLLGLAAGFLLHRSDFCLAGAFRDVFLFRRTLPLRCLALGVAASAALFEGARLLGLVPLYPFPLLKAASAGNLLGGAVFGLGMTLAGGCVIGTLYRAGAGHLLSAVAVAGLVAGSGLYAEVHPLSRALEARTALLGGAITLPQATGLSPALLAAGSLAVTGWALSRWRRPADWVHPARPEGYVQPWTAAVGLALLGAASLVLVGMPLGVTTSYAKAAAGLETLLWPGHVAALPFFRALPLDYVHPWSGSRLTGGPGPALDGIALIQLPLIAGLVLGGAASALRLGEFSPTWRVPPLQAASAFGGGVLMAVGSRVGGGCNVWHLLGGIPVWAVGSLLFALGLLPGAWAGGRLVAALAARATVPVSGPPR